jgi:hypothetical protein
MARAAVEGLTDDGFFWEPVADCWTIRKDARGHWSADYPEAPHPDPPPFTTIGWRRVHVIGGEIGALRDLYRAKT